MFKGVCQLEAEQEGSQMLILKYRNTQVHSLSIVEVVGKPTKDFAVRYDFDMSSSAADDP